jgi:hypothetical protein
MAQDFRGSGGFGNDTGGVIRQSTAGVFFQQQPSRIA